MGRTNKDAKVRRTKKVGRPKIVIDYEEVEKLASIMCTMEEIAVMNNCSVRTLERDKQFCQTYKRGLENGKMSLRRKQYKLADTNATMGIWLGKIYLDQVDKSSLNVVERVVYKTDATDLSDEELEKLLEEKRKLAADD